MPRFRSNGDHPQPLCPTASRDRDGQFPLDLRPGDLTFPRQLRYVAAERFGVGPRHCPCFQPGSGSAQGQRPPKPWVPLSLGTVVGVVANGSPRRPPARDRSTQDRGGRKDGPCRDQRRPVAGQSANCGGLTPDWSCTAGLVGRRQDPPWQTRMGEPAHRQPKVVGRADERARWACGWR